MKTVLSILLYALNALVLAAPFLGASSTGTLVALPPTTLLVWYMLEVRGAKRHVPGWLHSAYALISLYVWLIAAGTPERVFDRPLYVLHVLMTIATAASCSRWLGRLFFKPYVALLLIWTGFLLLHTKQVSFIALYVAALLWVRPNRERFLCILRSFSWKSMVPAVAAIGYIGFLGNLRLAPRGELMDQVVAQPGVEALIDLGSGEWPYGIGHQIRFVADSCDGRSLLIGLMEDKQGKEMSLVRFSLESRAFEFNHDIRRASNLAIVDCDRNMFTVGSEVTETVSEFQGSGPLVPSRTFHVRGSRPRFLIPIDGRRHLALVNDGDFSLDIIDLATSERVPMEPTYRSQCVFSTGEDRLWIVPFYDPLTVEVFDLSRSPARRIPRSELENELGPGVVVHSGQSFFQRMYMYGDSPRIPGGRAGWCAFNPRTATLWFPHLSSGEVRTVSLRTGAPSTSIQLEPGVRFLSFDDAFQRLAAVNYLTGDIHIIDADTLAIGRRVRIGPRVRFADFSRDGRYLYAASSAGLFRIGLSTGAEP